jgi:hypothetical protein
VSETATRQRPSRGVASDLAGAVPLLKEPTRGGELSALGVRQGAWVVADFRTTDNPDVPYDVWVHPPPEVDFSVVRLPGLKSDPDTGVREPRDREPPGLSGAAALPRPDRRSPLAAPSGLNPGTLDRPHQWRPYASTGEIHGGAELCGGPLPGGPPRSGL